MHSCCNVQSRRVVTQKVPVGYAHAFLVDAFPVDARDENVMMMMMSDDDDDDEADAN